MLPDDLGYHEDGDYNIHYLATRYESVNNCGSARKGKGANNLTKEALREAQM